MTKPRDAGYAALWIKHKIRRQGDSLSPAGAQLDGRRGPRAAGRGKGSRFRARSNMAGQTIFRWLLPMTGNGAHSSGTKRKDATTHRILIKLCTRGETLPDFVNTAVKEIEDQIRALK